MKEYFQDYLLDTTCIASGVPRFPDRPPCVGILWCDEGKLDNAREAVQVRGVRQKVQGPVRADADAAPLQHLLRAEGHQQCVAPASDTQFVLILEPI